MIVQIRLSTWPGGGPDQTDGTGFLVIASVIAQTPATVGIAGVAADGATARLATGVVEA